MNAFATIDFGQIVPGEASLTSFGASNLDGLLLKKKVNVIRTVPAGSGAVLPSSYSPGSEIIIMNRGANTLRVWPAPGNQIERFGVDSPLAVDAGVTVNLASFDPPVTPKPRTWWICYWIVALPGAGLYNDGGVLATTDLTYPTVAPITVGGIYSNAGAVAVSGVTTPDPAAPPVFFGQITSTQLLALGGANLPLIAPPAGSLILWNYGGEVFIA